MRSGHMAAVGAAAAALTLAYALPASAGASPAGSLWHH